MITYDLRDIENMVQGSEEWHKLRSECIGASDSSSILGLSPYQTPYGLWELKCGYKTSESNAAMKRGNDLEPTVRSMYNTYNQTWVIPKVVIHPQRSWMIASLDGISKDGLTVVEIKCNGNSNHCMALKGDVPDHHFAQCQHQLEVTGLDRMDYCSYNDNFEDKAFVVVPVHRDQDFIDDMLVKEEAFYKCMTTFTPPELCDRDYRNFDDDNIWRMTTEKFREIKNKIEDLEEVRDDLRNILISLSGGFPSRGNGVRLSKVITKGNVDYKRIVQEIAPEIDIDLYRGASRESFRISEEK